MVAFGADQGFAQAALDVDAVGVFLRGAGEIADRLVRVGHCQHHIVEVAFIHDVHVLEGAGDGILAGFLAAACYCDDACNEGGQ